MVRSYWLAACTVYSLQNGNIVVMLTATVSMPVALVSVSLSTVEYQAFSLWTALEATRFLAAKDAPFLLSRISCGLITRETRPVPSLDTIGPSMTVTDVDWRKKYIT